MALTKLDLNKIDALIDYKIETSFEQKFEEKIAPLRNDIKDLKNIIIEMHRFITIEFPLLSKRVDDHEVRIEALESHT